MRSIVLLLHEGGQQSGPTPDPSGCTGFSGAVTGIVSQLDPAYGVVVSGHTHRSYSLRAAELLGRQHRRDQRGDATARS